MTTKPYHFIAKPYDRTDNRLAALEAAVTMLTAGFHVPTPLEPGFHAKGPSDAAACGPNTTVKYN